MAAKDSNVAVRGVALYMLAHTNDVDHLLPALGRAIYDPSSYVRNNAMRMMGQMAERYPDLAYPIEDLVRAMDFAITTDRNKAAYTLAKLTKSRHRERIAELALPSALRQLRLTQPINHEPAFDLLKGISGENFGERDYEAWDRWYEQYLADTR
jgi:HEAT repeat protein